MALTEQQKAQVKQVADKIKKIDNAVKQIKGNQKANSSTNGQGSQG